MGVRVRVRSTVFLVCVSLAVVLARDGQAYPGPGAWTDISPPDSFGSPVQASVQVGTGHVFGIVVLPVTVGGSVDVRMARWLFATVSFDYFVPWTSLVGGPTLSLGKDSPEAFRVVLEPRFGMDSHGGSIGGVLGGNAYLDMPIAPRGSARIWAGVKYSYAWVTGPVYAHNLFALLGFIVHVADHLDLGLQIAGNPVFATNEDYSSGECCSGRLKVVTFTFQMGFHIGPVTDQRSRLPTPKELRQRVHR